MKKLALAAAITTAAILSNGAHAQVANADLAIGFTFPPPPNNDSGFDVEVDCSDPRLPPNQQTFLSVATTLAASFLTGTVCLDPSLGPPPYVLLQFGLTTSVATGRGGPGGTWFDSGTTDIYVDTGGGWGYFMTVFASNPGDEVDCLVNGGRGAQPGLVWPAAGPFYAALPGPFAAPVFNPGPACFINVLGMPAELYLF